MAESVEISVGGGNCEDGIVKHSMHSDNLNRTGYLTYKPRLAFTSLRKAFTKALIFRHFNLKCHIRIEIDVLYYAISGVLNELTLDNLNQWHLVVYFSQKMISAKTRCKAYNSEFFAIVEAFKTWCHYLEGCKHKVLILTDHNNLRQFMETKGLSFC